MSDERERSREAVRACVERLTPETCEAFVRVYDLLVAFGLRGLAEHPECVPEMAARAQRRAASG